MSTAMWLLRSMVPRQEKKAKLGLQGFAGRGTGSELLILGKVGGERVLSSASSSLLWQWRVGRDELAQ